RPRGNEEGFVSKLSGAYLKQKKLIEFPRISKTQFAIHHYAGTIKYEAMGFLEKHKDALLSDLSDLMCGSHEPFPQMLFKVKAEIEAAATAELKRQKSVPLYEKSCIVARAQIEETLSPTTSFCISQRYAKASL
ncbi:hypothetical protein PC120_g26539, partial [Phytophthora cactorum]